jgi:hypothetical protein
MSSVLDHLVINARFELDAAAVVFAGLGFTLTPRGHHSLGSINHLIMFREGYLELIGLPPGGERLRQEILDSSVGIDGLVLASDDPYHTHAALVAQGFDIQDVQHFSRPVDIDGAIHDARFGTVRLQPGQFAAGRVYFCHHETPELVWRPEWLGHANGVWAIERLTAVSADPGSTSQSLDRLVPDGDGRTLPQRTTLPGGFHMEVLDANAWRERAGPSAIFAGERPERFVAIGLRGGDHADIARRATSLGLPIRQQDERLSVAIPALDTVLEFLP